MDSLQFIYRFLHYNVVNIVENISLYSIITVIFKNKENNKEFVTLLNL